MLIVMLKGGDGENHTFAVRLYGSDLSYDKGFYDRWYELMPKGRRERADRFRNEIDRHRCIAAYALLVSAILELTEDTDLCMEEETLTVIRSGSLDIREDDRGKPFLPDIPVSFNISHAGERVAVALSHTDVGCDVERRNNNAMSVAKRFFAAEEYRLLSETEDEKDRRHVFTRLWTLKESVVKCCGEGIIHPFDDFSVVDVHGNIKQTVDLPGSENDYHIKEFDGENDYCYAVCSIYDGIEDSIRRIRIDEDFSPI